MTTHIADPISEIKKAEEKANNRIETAKKNFDIKSSDFKEELANERVTFEENLKKTCNERLEESKKEAEELYKSKMAEGKMAKSKLTQEAKEKESSAAKEVVSIFMDYINK